MQPKTLFVLKVTVASVALFAVWPYFIVGMNWIVAPPLNVIRAVFGAPGLLNPVGEIESHFLIPAFAVMLSSAGVTHRRRLAFLAGTAGAFALLDATAISMNVAAMAVDPRPLPQVLVTLYFTLMFAFSIVAVFAFVGGDTERLWKPRAA